MDFCHSREKYLTSMENNYWILPHTTKKTGQDVSKNCFEKVVHKAAEATEEFMGNEISNRIVK